MSALIPVREGEPAGLGLTASREVATRAAAGLGWDDQVPGFLPHQPGLPSFPSSVFPRLSPSLCAEAYP